MAHPVADGLYSLSRGTGDPILFIHGIPTSCHLWDGIVDRLASQFACVAVDLPGCGRTPVASQGLRALDEIVASIEKLRANLNIQKWHVVGHDAGCAIGIHYAHQFPSRVGRLALLTPSVFPDLKPFHLFEILRKRFVGELMAPTIGLIFWKFVMRWSLNGNCNNAVDDFRAPFRGARGSWRLMSLLRWGDPAAVLASIPTVLPQLQAPTLLFHGSRDPAVPAVFARRAKGLIPNSEVIILDSGHFLPLNEPAIIAKALSRFFGDPEGFVVQSAQSMLACEVADPTVELNACLELL